MMTIFAFKSSSVASYSPNTATISPFSRFSILSSVRTPLIFWKIFISSVSSILRSFVAVSTVNVETLTDLMVP